MATGGNPVTVFRDFISMTGPVVYSGPGAFINEASKRNYLLNAFTLGSQEDMAELIKGGPNIKDWILKDDASTFQFYHPNAMFTWANPQVMKDHEAYWRYGLDYMAWVEQEILHQMAPGMSGKQRHEVYKRVQRKIEARMWTSMMNGMENALTSAPDATQMEDADGIQPYSLIALCNEETNGLYTGFSTYQGINPSTDTYWVPNQVTYDYSDPRDTNNNDTGLFNAFDEMTALMRFDPPPRGSEYFERYYTQRFICTSLGGKLLYKSLIRKSNTDLLTGSSRADPSVQRDNWEGHDIREVDNLQSAAVYDDGASGRTTWDLASSPGPRFQFFNSEYVKMVFHAERYFHAHDIKDHPNQVGSYRQPVVVWYNLFCRSRKRGCGIVYPQVPAS